MVEELAGGVKFQARRLSCSFGAGFETGFGTCFGTGLLICFLGHALSGCGGVTNLE
jgi:hypothetical protein